MDLQNHPLWQFYLAIQPLVPLIDPGETRNPMPSEAEVSAMDNLIRNFCEEQKPTTASQALKIFMDQAYSGNYGLIPQFPRQDMEAWLSLLQEANPVEWAELTHFYGLPSN